MRDGWIMAAAYWGWMAFLVGWWLAARWTNRATSRGAMAQRIGYFAGFALGFGLLCALPPVPSARHHPTVTLGMLLPAAWAAPLWRAPLWLGGSLIAAELAAFAFAWWARLHLGRLWSGMLTLREGHRVVDSGPYARVRHPIYTGFIAAAWALALNAAAPMMLLGALVLTIVMTVKAGAEERLLARALGPASYADYRRRVPMLIPFAPR